MMTLLELAKLSAAVYDTPPSAVDGWHRAGFQTGRDSGMTNDLQAAVYNKASGGTAVAFRGTTLSLSPSHVYAMVQDLYADLSLGQGEDVSDYSAAGIFMKPLKGRPDVVVCGHSLGGAIAQIIGNRMRLRIATFNAPGVGVLASRNIGEARLGPLALRVGGMMESAVLNPVQTVQDMGAAFHRVKGVNVRLDGDRVSQWGEQYGRILTIPGPRGAGWMEQHKIATVVDCLSKQPQVGGRDILSFD